MFRTPYGVGVDFTPFGERLHTSCTFGVSLWLVPHFYKDNLSLMFKKILAGATALTVASGAFTVASADVVDNLVKQYNDLGGGVWSVAGADAAQDRVDEANYKLVSTEKKNPWPVPPFFEGVLRGLALPIDWLKSDAQKGHNLEVSTAELAYNQALQAQAQYNMQLVPAIVVPVVVLMLGAAAAASSPQVRALLGQELSSLPPVAPVGPVASS